MTVDTRDDSGKSPSAPIYEVAIPSRQEITAYLRKCKSPCRARTLAVALNVERGAAFHGLTRRLGAMCRCGELLLNRRGYYGIPAEMDLVRGRVIGHTEGYGFLNRDEEGPDLYLSAVTMRSLLHGDTILARQMPSGRKKDKWEGVLVEILERATEEVVGRLCREEGVDFVIPEEKRLPDVLIPSRHNKARAKTGQYVVVRITHYPDRHTQPMGEVIHILGDERNYPLMQEVVMRTYDLTDSWPEAVEAEIARLPDQVLDEECRDRRDLRALPLVTIDDASARDFDDAVCCERTASGFRLIVAIADVSHYVRPGSALSDEAARRGTSVYFPSRVVPMLPEKLSNELCSLKPKVDRLCFVCEMEFSHDGKRTRHQIYRAVMCSKARLTYIDVATLLNKEESASSAVPSSLHAPLMQLHELFTVLRARRKENGLMDIDSTEDHFVFNEAEELIAIDPRPRNDAHKLIEEFMLAANKTVAEELIRQKIPAVYRNHAPPAALKLEGLHAFLGEFGLALSGGETPTAADYAKLLDAVRDRADAHLFHMLLLRSMQLAVYEAENKGHFGLSFDKYTHFTSPIRRYPDLLVHRALASMLDKNAVLLNEESSERMQKIAEHCSLTERRAEEASRDLARYLKCAFMQKHVGDTFSGIISSVTAFGLFVELSEIRTEGLIHITALPSDYYRFDPLTHRLRGETHGRSYRLGDAIRVKVARVDLDEKKIDFELAKKLKSHHKK